MTIRRCFTLFELLVCILILSLIAGLTAMPIKRALDHYRAKNHLQRLANKMEQLLSLAINYQMQMKLSLYKKEGRIYYRFDSEEPLKFMKRSAVCLEGVSTFFFNEKASDSAELIFRRDGMILPSGVLSFELKQERFYIDFNNKPTIKLSVMAPTKVNDHFIAIKDIE